MARTMRIRKDDQVMVIGGKDAGKTGASCAPSRKSSRVYVEHLNMIKRHERPRSVKDAERGGQVGGIVEKVSSCFVGASEEQIAKCEMPVPHEVEERLVEAMGDPGETVVAFALLR